MIYPKPCRAEFGRLAKINPTLLIDWVEADLLEPEHLTFAAESLGSVPEALPTLLTLLKHESPIVREGALIGLYNLQVMVIEEVHSVALTDSSITVRRVATRIWNRLADYCGSEEL
jgi:hypothetical protein